MKKNSTIFTAIFFSLFLFSCNIFNQENNINSNENFGVSNEQNNNGALDWPSIADRKSLSAENGISQFVDGSKDIPLANNLQKISDDDLGFDSTSGSIVSVAYKSGDKLKKVQEFYTKTLPQLGWKNIEGGAENASVVRFERDKEKLEIEFLNDGKVVKFFIETLSH